MIAMDDIHVEFNGVDLYETFGLMSCSVDGQKPHIFAGSKSVATVSPMYKSAQTNIAMIGEPLSFSLTFALKEDEEWTDELAIEVYKVFDVDTYKPLRFGGEDMYYNCIPFVGSVSEMMLFAQNGGYITVSFQCDAPHGWIDKNYDFSRRSYSEAAHSWNIFNSTTVKGYEGDYRCWPYIIIDHLGEDENGDKIAGNEDGYFISFGLDSQIEGYDEQAAMGQPTIGDRGWLNLYWLPLNTVRVEIDTYNQQIYGITEYTEETVIGGQTTTITKQQEENFLPYMKSTHDGKSLFYFPFLEEGENKIKHRAMQYHYDNGQSNYKIHFYLNCPYMK